MIICKAPFRVSLFGGGSDYPSFIDKYGYGLVISSAVNKYAYVQVKELPPFFPYKSRLTYSEIECINDWSDIKHRVFKYCIAELGLEEERLEINFTSDLPGGIGLGTSSTMIVCMLEALYQYKHNRTWPDKNDLWLKAANIEQNLMDESVGFQDYLPAIHGWSYGYRITKDKAILLPLNNSVKEAVSRFGLLFYLGKTRNSSNIINNYIDKLHKSDNQFRILQLAEKALQEENIELLGYYLYESWLAKKDISPAISNDHIDTLIDIIIDKGAYGAKLCGGGNSGCVFVIAPPHLHYNIIKSVRAAGAVQIPYEISTRGVQRIL